jgi:hypothetical protein
MSDDEHCDYIYQFHDIIKNEKGGIDRYPIANLNNKLKLEKDSNVRYQMFLDFQKKFREGIKNVPSKDRYLFKRMQFRITGNYEEVHTMP